MMNLWRLPTSLNVGGVEYAIRTDFRDILYILSCFGNDEYTDSEKWTICIRILYKDWKNIPVNQYEEAARQAKWFLDYGMEDDGGSKRKMVDWEQDAKIIIPSINKVLGFEIREKEHMHWWTFLGAYMEIGEGVFSEVVNIRSKKARGKKLEKWENEFYRENKKLVDFKIKYTKEELEEQERLKALLG